MERVVFTGIAVVVAVHPVNPVGPKLGLIGPAVGIMERHVVGDERA